MAEEVLDDFADVSGWMPVASGLAQLTISPDRDVYGAALRLDFDFHGGGGFVVARKTLVRSLPESYALHFSLRGTASPHRFEVKLADGTGRNVWWKHWDEFAFPPEWQAMTLRSRDFEFAWGPAGGGVLRELGAIEFAIAAGADGGAGTVWIGGLRCVDRSYRSTPVVQASSALPDHPAGAALEENRTRGWRSLPGVNAAWLAIDFVEVREYGGLVVHWDTSAPVRAFRVETSDDGARWTTVHTAEAIGVDTSYVYLPGTESRRLRLGVEAATNRGCGIAKLDVQPFEFSRSITAFLEHVARDAPRGQYPRWLAGEQSYWTPIGLPDGQTSAIMNEEGLIEFDRGSPSIEPFLFVDDRLLTWADVAVTQALVDGWIPVPASRWVAGDLSLDTTACATRAGETPVLCVHYRVTNRGNTGRRATLFVAVRPFQVNPPWQTFGDLGGARRIRTLSYRDGAVWIDAERAIVPLTVARGFGAVPFELGSVTSYLVRCDLPPRAEVDDPFGYASGALAFEVDLAPGESRDVNLAIPFGNATAATVGDARGIDGARVFGTVVGDWWERLGGVAFTVPDAAREATDTARAAAAQVLVNRDGAALQPGPRRYTRAWIRDGAIMAAALLRLGRGVEACAFVRWYATFQRADGNVPCCVDRTGPDWLAEHDSHGEFIFAAMECFRFTHDRTFLAEMWPAVRGAVDYLETLRATRLGPAFEAPAVRARRGLMPESVSHEGYLAHPVHAYWDDFWALQGYRDAAAMAAILGEDDEARRIGAGRDELGAAVRASLACTIADRGIDYVPGSVEWADFDPTATANAVGLLDAVEDLPRETLERTFDRYLEGFRQRRDGAVEWNNYSAYEIRIVGALVRLGRRADAAELLDFFLADRRPAAWRQWPEISWRDRRSPGHIGDVPHTWIGAEYVLALRSLFAYERRVDDALVVAGGIPADWLAAGDAVGVSGLPTPYGTLDLHCRRTGVSKLVVSVGGALTVPPGGLVLQPPLAGPLARVTVNGQMASGFDAAAVTVRVCPAEVVLTS